MAEGSREIELLLKHDSLDNTTSKRDYSTSTPPSSDSHTSEATKVYRRRWYILAVFSAMVFVANFYINTLSPIQDPVKLILHWEGWNILLFNALAMVSVLFFTAPITWLAVFRGT